MSSKSKKIIFRFNLNLGNGFVTSDPDEAASELLRREFPNVNFEDKKQNKYLASPPIYFPTRHDLPEPTTKAFEDFLKTLLNREKADGAEKTSDSKNPKKERQELLKNQEGSLLELATVRAFENLFKLDCQESESQNVTLLQVFIQV
jgi:hypothetical protein